MRKATVCLCLVVVFILFSIQAAHAASKVNALLRLLIKKGVITEQEATQLEEELELEEEAAKTELKVEVKEELADEGLPLPTGGRLKIYGEAEIAGYVQEQTSFTRKYSCSFLESVIKVGAKADLTDQIDADFRIAAVNTAGGDTQLFGTTTDDVKMHMDVANLKFKEVFGWPLTLTLGRQEICIGDGFLIEDGYYDKVAQYENPFHSFDAARATFERDPFTLDLFAAYLDNDWIQYQGYYVAEDTGEEEPEYQDQLPSTAHTAGGELYGANLHYEGQNFGIWDFGTFFRNDDSQLYNNTLALSAKYDYDVPFISGLKLEGETVYEFGETNQQQAKLLTGWNIDRRSIGGHWDATYTFQTLPFSPYFGGGFIYLPGDDPDTPGKNEAFDPLFFGDQDWGKWYIGNIVGGSGQIINSNERVFKLEVGCTPTSSTQLRAQFFNIRLDRGIDSDFSKKNYADEVNVIFDYWPNEIFYCGAEFGFAHPLEAAKYWNADEEEADEDTYEFIIWTGVEF